MARRLLLVRHGPVAEGHARQYVGSMEPPISADWASQSLASWVQSLKPAKCYCSPQLRARQTFDLIARPQGLAGQLEEDLREIDFGRWEGKTFEQIQAEDPTAAAAWADFREDFTFPDGEAVSAFIARTARAARRLAEGPAEVVLVVTHGGVVRMLICHLLGLPTRHFLLFDVRRGGCAVVDVFDGGKSHKGCGTGVLSGLNLPAQEGL